MKITRARIVLRTRLAYLNAKIAVAWSPPLERERDALDLALRILKWRDDDDADLAVESKRAAEIVVPAEQRMRVRVARGDELRERAHDLVVAIRRAVHIGGRRAA